MSDWAILRRAAERASRDPFYLASALLAYARAERLDDTQLAAHLECDVAHLPTLLLCRRPTGEGAVFRRDVETIAERFALDAVRLAQALRRADALGAFDRVEADRKSGLLAAARDRKIERDGQARHDASSSEPGAAPPGPNGDAP